MARGRTLHGAPTEQASYLLGKMLAEGQWTVEHVGEKQTEKT